MLISFKTERQVIEEYVGIEPTAHQLIGHRVNHKIISIVQWPVQIREQFNDHKLLGDYRACNDKNTAIRTSQYCKNKILD